MEHYILSQKTEEDIESIYDFGKEKFGKDQALNYLIELRSHFELLLKNPGIGKLLDEIKVGLFSFSCQSHTIFYRVFKDNIRTPKKNKAP